jgi:hypothetical protein
LSVLQLTSVTGSSTVLSLYKTWSLLGLELPKVPSKSSFSEMRDKVSFEFFKDIFEDELLQSEGKTFRGYSLYAVDGDDLNLPCSEDLITCGYRGRLYSKNFETHYPKMYTVFAYDILNESVAKFSYSKKHQEFRSALEFIKELKPKSIAIYDRLYGSYPMMSLHEKHKNYYIVRMKVLGTRLPDPLFDFIESKERDKAVIWSDSKNAGEDISVRLVKVFNKKTKEMLVFATNLSKEEFSPTEILALYRKRWSIESCFRDLTSTLKLGEWHSKKINGILQEIYALLWFFNKVRSVIRTNLNNKDFLKHKKYKRSNFKISARIVMENLDLLIAKKVDQLSDILTYWIQRTQETRVYRSRSYPRVVKRKLSKFPVHSKVPRRSPP